LADRAPTDDSVVDVRLYLPRTALEELARLAEHYPGVQEPELVRRSISLMSFVQGLTNRGSELLVEWPDGHTERVVLPQWWTTRDYR